MKKKLWLLALGLAVSTILVACGPGGDTASEGGEESKGTLEFRINNWAENIAVSNMWKILLGEEGYEVNLQSAEKTVVFQDVARGEADIAPEVWLPYTDQSQWEEYGDDLVQGDSWYDGTVLGIAVPTYMEDLNSIEDLNNYAEELDGTIYGIEPGSSIAGLTDEVVTEYGLELQHQPASEATMLTELQRAYEAEEPVAVTMWSPHWALAEFDIKYLDDPKGVYGEPDNIFYVTRKDFADDFPELVPVFDAWKMDDTTLGALMASINETGDPEEGAQAWIDENEDVWGPWMDELE
ncbi:glycine betaine ABC transporter substrate-binding protein [Bacillus fonticola]|uniref:glycine betaine ABC transporter substrate-binding protein n=1 Tax=Bacillus fonticola TaxID=2728853 RepID=UPI0014762BF2|nr:glycine betaine ABC transporter substrate-binding protein [Bacillus fonticola]